MKQGETVLRKTLRGIKQKCIIAYNNALQVLSLHLYKRDNIEPANQQAVRDLRGKYAGKRIFVVCNGPSLRPEDLDTLNEHGEYTFGANLICKIFSKTRWRPTFYTVMDDATYEIPKEMNSVPAKLHFYKKNSYVTTRRVKASKVFFNGNGDRALLDNPSFSTELDKEVNSIGTVTFSMLEYAVWMGFKEIYLIGCDCRYAKELQRDGTFKTYDTNSYFEGNSKKYIKGNGSTWEMIIAYECARKFADAHGIKIFNATRGGYLEAFERVDFDSLFPKKEMYS